MAVARLSWKCSGTSHSMACKTLDSATYAFKVPNLHSKILTLYKCFCQSLSTYDQFTFCVKYVANVGFKGLNPDVCTGCCGYTEWGQSPTLPLSLSSAELSGGSRHAAQRNIWARLGTPCPLANRERFPAAKRRVFWVMHCPLVPHILFKGL